MTLLTSRSHSGLTHVLDKGLGPRGWEDVLEMAGDYISIVKLGWGTAYVTRNLERKLAVLREKPVVIGGTFFEAVYAAGDLDEYKRWLAGLGLTHVEISDGTRRHPARAEARAHRRLRARLHRPLRGRLEGLVRRVHGRRVGHVAQRRPRRRRVEGHHRGARGRHGGDLRLERRHAHRADRRDRPRGRPGERHLRGAVEGRAELVHQAASARA